MNKEEFWKKIECLKAWKEYALNGVVKNIVESDKITMEIAELKDRHRHLLN